MGMLGAPLRAVLGAFAKKESWLTQQGQRPKKRQPRHAAAGAKRIVKALKAATLERPRLRRLPPCLINSRLASARMRRTSRSSTSWRDQRDSSHSLPDAAPLCAAPAAEAAGFRRSCRRLRRRGSRSPAPSLAHSKGHRNGFGALVIGRERKAAFWTKPPVRRGIFLDADRETTWAANVRGMEVNSRVT